MKKGNINLETSKAYCESTLTPYVALTYIFNNELLKAQTIIDKGLVELSYIYSSLSLLSIVAKINIIKAIQFLVEMNEFIKVAAYNNDNITLDDLKEKFLSLQESWRRNNTNLNGFVNE